MGVRKIFHAPTFGQETGDGPDSLVLKGRCAGAGHTAPFDLMHPERIRAKEMGKWCISGNGVLFHGCQPKKKMCKDEGGEISVMVCHSKAGGVKFILIVVIRVGGG